MREPGLQRLTCDNPSPMTLEGTNTYILGSPQDGAVVVVDPGPAGHPEHLDSVIAAIGSAEVLAILVTHRHRDHTGAAKTLSERIGAPVRGFDPAQSIDSAGQTAAPLHDGEELSLPGQRVVVRHTPGHTSDSVCLWLPESAAVITGDTILGRGTTMLDYPDGTLTDYLGSLELLSGYAEARMLPAHGPERPDISACAQDYLAHRLERLDQVRRLLDREGPGEGPELDAARLGRLIYGEDSGLPEGVTTKIAEAQLAHLRHLGEL